MASLPLTIKSGIKTTKIKVEMDKNKFERLMASFGFFSQEFIESLDISEKDYLSGRVRKINSLKSLNA